jgi:hypothetical protein
MFMAGRRHPRGLQRRFPARVSVLCDTKYIAGRVAHQEVAVRSLVAVVAPIVLAALGGALAVFGSYDDSPGGSLLGALMVLGAMALGVKNARRAS